MEEDKVEQENEAFQESQYLTFLKSLDNENLISHINHISQTQELRHNSFQGVSTPKKITSQVSNASSDPFNDGLDDQIINLLGGPLPPELDAKNSVDVIGGIENGEDNVDCCNSSNSGNSGNSGNNNNEDEVAMVVLEHSPLLHQTGAIFHALPAEESDASESDKDEASIGALHEFNDYGTYLDSKLKKQQRQDEAYIAWDQQRRRQQKLDLQPKQMFKGCTIFVNGHTKPSINEIHRLVILHGGKFLSYMANKSVATHIICDRLTPRKNVMFKNYKVVKAQWIVDCVEAGELLDWQRYRLIMDVAYDQKRLNFPQRRERTISEEESEYEDVFQNGDNVARDIDQDNNEQVHKKNKTENRECMENYGRDNGSKDDLNDNLNDDLNDYGEENQVLSILAEEPDILERQQMLELQRSILSNSTYEDNLDDDEEIVDLAITNDNGEPPSEGKGVHRIKGKYVLDARHPDFLRGFFANSRLHHLSMWKADLRLKFLRRIVKEHLHKPKPQDRFAASSINNLVQNNNDNKGKRVIMHIDFDCFFATASCLKHPNLDIDRDPIAVGHGGKTSDVASCNYVARKYGVRNGMWFRLAQALCPNLTLLDYEFEIYEKCSSEFYNYLVTSDYFDTIFPVSIDEVLVDASSYCFKSEKPIEEAVTELCSLIRKHVFQLTKCSVSIGASFNVLLAKLAIKRAKPNGQFFLHNDIEKELFEVPIKDLPGFGKGILEKLEPEINKTNPKILDIINLPRSRLILLVGEKTGTKLHEYARGIDNTSIEVDTSNPEAVLGRKSISVDVNFGIRFDTVEELDEFFMRLARELYERMVNLGLCGSILTLKLAKRAPGADVVTAKFLGLGQVEFVNKSSRLGVATNDWGVIGNEIKVLYRMINIPVKDLRGISVSMTKLKDVDSMKSSKQMTLPFGRAATNRNKVSYENGSPFKNTCISKTESKLKVRAPIEAPSFNNLITRPRVGERLVFSREDIARRRKRPKTTSSDPLNNADDIDWDVFNSLPIDIRRELECELKRRGMLPEQRSPPKGKSYLQQVFLTQVGGKPKYVRVIESPTKTTKKKRKTSASPSPSPGPGPGPGLGLGLGLGQVLGPSPAKSKQNVVYEESQSYDTMIVNELPSSIRADVLKDMEYKKKIRNFDLVPMREKMNRKMEEAKVDVDLVTLEWLDKQPKLNEMPLFLNENVTPRQMKTRLCQWVDTSLSQEGPHEEDVAYFIAYIAQMIEVGQINRAIVVVETIRDHLQYHISMLNCGVPSNNNSLQTTLNAIEDWRVQLNTKIYSALKQNCKNRNISIEF